METKTRNRNRKQIWFKIAPQLFIKTTSESNCRIKYSCMIDPRRGLRNIFIYHVVLKINKLIRQASMILKPGKTSTGKLYVTEIETPGKYSWILKRWGSLFLFYGLGGQAENRTVIILLIFYFSIFNFFYGVIGTSCLLFVKCFLFIWYLPND